MTFNEMQTFATINQGKRILVKQDDNNKFWLWSNKGWINATYNECRGLDFSLLPIKQSDITFDIPDILNNEDDGFEYDLLTFKEPNGKVEYTYQIFEELDD